MTWHLEVKSICVTLTKRGRSAPFGQLSLAAALTEKLPQPPQQRY